MENFLRIFFDIMTIYNDEICYVGHVLDPLCVFFTLFGCWGGCFEAESNKCEKSTDRPVCYCSPQHRGSWERGGPITVRDGHFCLLPVSISFNDTRLGSKDPLPMDGSSCRADAVTDLEHLARLLNVPMPNIGKLLPHSVFHTSRGMLSHVQSVARDLSQFAIIRIVDKSPGSMWGFCRAWVWDQTTAFLHAEKYSISTETRGDLLQGLLDLLQSKGWVASDKARLALLHLIGKGKSLSLKPITWRPICAQSAPVIPRWRLRLAARAFTCFLKFLSSHITGSFLHQSIQDVGRWMLDLNTWHCTVIGEADCEDQFNRILPSDVLQHFHEATEWLRSECRWRAPQMFWSLHKYDKTLDRAGKAAAFNFDVISHQELTELLQFCLQTDSLCVAAGSCWSRAFALPMGGPFSAQAADLHSLWCFHLRKQQFYSLGKLSFTDAGYPVWVNSRGRVVSLAQFRDNILVASKGLGSSWAMADVCNILQRAWSLRVLCPCISNSVNTCQLTCMSGQLHAPGVAMERRDGYGEVYVHPSALTPDWSLKQGAPLQSPWAVNETSLANLFTGVLMNCRVFQKSWAEFLLSAAAWLQISLLCHHQRAMTVRACQKSLHRLLSYTPHNAELSQRWITYISHDMPCSKTTVRTKLEHWLRVYATWDNDRYASWHIPHSGPHTDWCGDWSTCCTVHMSPPSGGGGRGPV